jgi:carboxypeptidase T
MIPLSGRLAAVMIVLTFLALLIESKVNLQLVSAQTGRLQRLASNADSRRAKQALLKEELASTRLDQFQRALATLSALDEQGALEVWEVALANPDPELRRQAWGDYARLWPTLARKELVPQVVRIHAPTDEVKAAANLAGLQINIWSASGGETIAAVPPYALDQLQQAGMRAEVLYDTIAEWSEAQARGDSLANQIVPEYQSEQARSQMQVRIAVIDLSRSGNPAQGYSAWLDEESILMRNQQYLAYLDVFASDGSIDSINARTYEQYRRRGFWLAGFFTTGEFAQVVGRFFPGKTFADGNSKPTAQATASGKYHSYQDALSELTELANQHPELAQLINLGQTYEGRQIFALKVTRDPKANDPTKPDVLITGAHHAREWISVEPPVYFAKQLVNGYAADDEIRYLLDHVQVWIVPVVNPDGLNYSQSAPSPQDPARQWRKNRRPISVSSCGAPVSGVGVDINRNYNFQWRLPGDSQCETRDDIGASDNPKEETYRGPEPNSELEVKALNALTGDPNHHFRARIDYHNFLQLILYPWGYQASATPDAETLASLGRRMSELIGAVGQFYQPKQSIGLYITTGSSIDYAYAVDRIPAPFVIELRPNCCSFDLPEDQIPAVNAENWPAAKMILEWAAGPPILESVKVYQLAPDGSFSKLVYSARWVESEGSRRMIVDARFPFIEPGRLQVQLKFSKSMNPSSGPIVTLGRNAPFDELKLMAVDEGWRKTVYRNDTWVGETVMPRGVDQLSEWRLAVSASDGLSFNLDAKPATVASYAIGTNSWQKYEGADGTGSSGGTDLEHLLPPLRSDELRIPIGAPRGGERLAGGQAYTVAWTVPVFTGFIPGQQEIWISTDGGTSYAQLAAAIPGNVEKYSITVPNTPTTAARIRILVIEQARGNAIFGDSPGNFTIGTNVGSALDVSVASSELIDQNWADEPSGASGSLRLAININLTNHSSTPITNPFLRVAELTRGNVLLSRDSNSEAASGGRQSLSAGGDNLISPGETIKERLVLGLVSRKKFIFSVDIYGVAPGGSVFPSNPFTIWRGKPSS